MKIIEWSQAYEVGVVDIDVDHRKLFASFNTFAESIIKKSEYKEIQSNFNELALRIEKHFAFEEAVLKKMACASYKEHHEIHQKLLVELKSFQETLNRQADETQTFMQKFGNTIRGWMLAHIAEDGEDIQGPVHAGSIQSNSAV